MTCLLVLVGFFLNVTAYADPYEVVTKTVLENGMSVYFAPGTRANTVTIQIDYSVGWNHEGKENMGVAHLLEHTLFRHPSLPPNMSFMEVVKEEGGSGNGYTMQDTTSYFTTIRSDKADWLLNWYVKLMIDRKIKPDYVDKGRKEVMLELGEKENQLDLFVKKILMPIKMPELGFWKTEFAIDDGDYEEDEVRDNTLKLNEKDVQSFYDRFYHPQNMKIFVAGDFNVDRFRDKIEKTFGQMKVAGEDGIIRKNPVPRRRPYILERLAKRDTYMSVGTKVWDINATDEMVLRSYLDYLSHRLMKDIRNLTGETYTAMDDVRVAHGYGYGLVSLQTTRDRYHDNLELVREYMEKEARKGEITDSQIEEAKSLYLKKFEIVDTDSGSLLNLARGVDVFDRDYREGRTPYMVVKQTEPLDYRERLKKMFKKEQMFEELYAPPIFFRGDDYATVAFLLVIIFFFFRDLFIQKFDHTKLRYVRKTKYAPMTLFLIFTCAYFPILFLNISQYSVRWLWDVLHFGSSLFLNSYVFIVVQSFIAVGAFLSYLALWPRKIMIVGNKLVIKSLTYYSTSIPLDQIKSIETGRSWHLIKKLGFRFRYADLAFFRKGLFLKTKKGFLNQYFFGFANAQAVKKELNSIIRIEPSKEMKKVS